MEERQQEALALRMAVSYLPLWQNGEMRNASPPPPGDTWVEKGLCNPIVAEDLAPLVPSCALLQHPPTLAKLGW